MNTDLIIKALKLAQEKIAYDRDMCVPKEAAWWDTYQDAIDEYIRLKNALEESVKLQSHYAALLNDYDGGERIGFENSEAWLKRLDEIKAEE